VTKALAKPEWSVSEPLGAFLFLLCTCCARVKATWPTSHFLKSMGELVLTSSFGAGVFAFLSWGLLWGLSLQGTALEFFSLPTQVQSMILDQGEKVSPSVWGTRQATNGAEQFTKILQYFSYSSVTFSCFAKSFIFNDINLHEFFEVGLSHWFHWKKQ